MTVMEQEILEKLKDYFLRRDEAVLAFVFGSQAKGTARAVSDWDIAAYFKPKKFAELETREEYEGENQIKSDVSNILKQDIDFLVMNRARPSLVFQILNTGTPLVVKDERLQRELLLKTHYEAVDFWRFAQEFWKIRERSASLSQEDKANLIEHLVFLENELKDIETFQSLTWKEYFEDRGMRRNAERWIENLVMTSLDIAKIILASEKKELPQTYRETLKVFGALYINESFGERLSHITELRNIIAHEYLDIRWDKIKKFIQEAEEIYKEFIYKVKEFLEVDTSTRK